MTLPCIGAWTIFANFLNYEFIQPKFLIMVSHVLLAVPYINGMTSKLIKNVIPDFFLGLLSQTN
jgi:hypothetical protein